MEFVFPRFHNCMGRGRDKGGSHDKQRLQLKLFPKHGLNSNSATRQGRRIIPTDDVVS